MKPICISQPHWETFISESKALLNCNPTSGIAGASLKLNDIETFPAVCDMRNRPLDALENKFNPGYTHTFVSFMGQLDDDTARHLRNVAAVKLTEYNNKVFIVTANISEWFDIVEAGLQLPGKATFYTYIRNFFLMTKFSALFTLLKVPQVIE